MKRHLWTWHEKKRNFLLVVFWFLFGLFLRFFFFLATTQVFLPHSLVQVVRLPLVLKGTATLEIAFGDEQQPTEATCRVDHQVALLGRGGGGASEGTLSYGQSVARFQEGSLRVYTLKQVKEGGPRGRGTFDQRFAERGLVK